MKTWLLFILIAGQPVHTTAYAEEQACETAAKQVRAMLSTGKAECITGPPIYRYGNDIPVLGAKPDEHKH